MTNTKAPGSRGFEASVFEQYTYFGTLQEDGDKVSNAAGQKIDSSITQLVLGYRFNGRAGVQFNLPVIYRSFRRPEGATIQNGSESGIGDVSWSRSCGSTNIPPLTHRWRSMCWVA
jgi:hypothetical protein